VMQEMLRYSACNGDARNVVLLRLQQWCKKCCVTLLATVMQEMLRYSACNSDARNVALLRLQQWCQCKEAGEVEQEMKNWRQVASTVKDKLLFPFISNNNLYPDNNCIAAS